MATKNFLIWGKHAVRATLELSADTALELWIKDGELSPDTVEIAALAETRGISTQTVAAKTLAKLSDGAVHQGVVLRRRAPAGLELNDFAADLASASANPLLLVLDQVQDPQNFGACLRVAEGAGVDAVLVPRDHSAPLSGTVAKAASGAIDTVRIIHAPNLARALDTLRDAGMWFVAASHESSQTIYDCDLTRATGLVFGAEGSGLRTLTRKKCDEAAAIPMAGRIASLNVSTAAAIGLFEARRQRRGNAG